MLKKFTFVYVLLFGSLVIAADSPPPAPSTPIVDPVVAVIDNKLVLVQDVLSPKVSILGAESSIGLGELVFLQAKMSDDLPSFVKSKVFKWTITDKSFREDSQNGSIFFGAGIKNVKIPVKVDVSETYQIGDQLIIKTSTQTINVQIGDGTPLPDPDPSPVPPSPVVPDLTGTQKEIYDLVQNTIGKNLSADDTKKASTIIAGDFDASIAKIKSGSYESFKAFSEDLKAMNQQGVKLLNLDIGKFDGFRSGLNSFLFSYYEKNGVSTNPMSPNGNGSLVGLSDWVPILEEITKGIRAAGK